MAAHRISKTVLVLHSAEQMFQLVDKVEDYAQFLPWYGKTEIIKRDEQNHELQARIHIDYMGVHQSFATHNHNTPPHQIKMNLLEGPFKFLHGTWTFTPVGDDACQIRFELEYELVGLFSKIISPVFGVVTGKLVEAFVQEANKRYA